MAQLVTLDWRPVEAEFVRQEFDVASDIALNELGATARFRDISATSGTANQYGYADFKYVKWSVSGSEDAGALLSGGHAVYLNNAVDHIVTCDLGASDTADGDRRPAGGFYYVPTTNQFGWVQINGFFPAAYATNSSSMAVGENCTRTGSATDILFTRATGTARTPNCAVVVIAAAVGTGVLELTAS
jgi:hypothetical protein